VPSRTCSPGTRPRRAPAAPAEARPLAPWDRRVLARVLATAVMAGVRAGAIRIANLLCDGRPPRPRRVRGRVSVRIRTSPGPIPPTGSAQVWNLTSPPLACRQTENSVRLPVHTSMSTPFLQGRRRRRGAARTSDSASPLPDPPSSLHPQVAHRTLLLHRVGAGRPGTISRRPPLRPGRAPPPPPRNTHKAPGRSPR